MNSFSSLDPAYLEKLRIRFWNKVDQSGGSDACWEWQGYKSKGKWGGYGMVYLKIGEQKDFPLLTHRVAYMLAVGDIPDDMFVCHKCDNPPCCNPAHLFLGTCQDNNLDMYRKGRNRCGAVQGDKCGSSKLTSEQVLEIVELLKQKMPYRKISERYGVGKAAISHIASGLNWSHLTGIKRKK